jgi:hypothetical protein
MYGVGDSVAPVGLDCREIDAASTLTSRVFSTYNIPPSVGLLRPALEDRPSRPRDGYAAVMIGSLVCGSRLPFLMIVQRILTRLVVHACQMSPAFYRLLATCFMEWNCETRHAMTMDDFRNLDVVFPAPGQLGFHMARTRGNVRLVEDSDPPSRRGWVWVSTDAFGEAPLRFGRLADFPEDEGTAELPFVREISRMAEARKAGERFRSPELMALTGWFPPFAPGTEEARRTSRPPSPEAQPAAPTYRGNFTVL